MSVDYKIRKIFAIAGLALILAFLGILLAQNSQETANINNVFEIIVNNTNLAPSVHDVVGTGERIQGVTYYANNSPIQILVFAHAQNVSQTAFVELTINNTIVLPQSGRPLGGAEQSNRSISTIIPKFASYKVDIENEHHYEWREYPILSGKNGTISINNSISQTYINNSYISPPNNFSKNGTYIGDGTNNRGIYHGLNRTPSNVNIIRSDNVMRGDIKGSVPTLLISSGYSSTIATVTAMNETYFYVSESPTSYLNNACCSHYWSAS